MGLNMGPVPGDLLEKPRARNTGYLHQRAFETRETAAGHNHNQSMSNKRREISPPVTISASS